MGGGWFDLNGMADAWSQILAHDYYPIFSTARKIVFILGDEVATQVMSTLFEAATKIVSRGLWRRSEVYGEVFQETIEDRKRLAAFYTRPILATLLATMTLPPVGDPTWKNPEKMKVADFACGTGTLLLSAYRTMATRYGIATGKKMSKLHAVMMKNCLIGGDVLPIAANLTASALAGMYPTKPFDNTQIRLVPLGGEGHHTGTLEWLNPQATIDSTFTRITGSGHEDEYLPPGNGSCDVILMNPPYTRSKSPGGSNSEYQGQMFEAFGIVEADRKKITSRAKTLLDKYGSGGCANAKAGLVTYFMDLIHEKITLGGRVGLVMPMTASSGVVWSKFRDLIAQNYADIVVINILGSTSEGTSVSGGTSMGELMISMRRLKADEPPPKRALFASLSSQPQSFIEAIEIGKLIHNTRAIKIESGVRGGTPLELGDGGGGDKIGKILDCPISEDIWIPVGIKNIKLAQTVYALQTHSKLVIPPLSEYEILMSTQGNMWENSVGPSHFEIIGNYKRANNALTTVFTGPFNKHAPEEDSIYPMLWNNDSETQTRLEVRPDSQAVPRRGETDTRLNNIASTMSRVHYNLGMRTTSQRLAVCYTKNLVIGGVAWPSIFMPTKFEKAFVVWHNTTLGLLCRWLYSNKQQLGRSIVSRTSLVDVPILAFDKLNKKQLADFDHIFDEIKNTTLLPIMDMWKDKTRIKMDYDVSAILGIAHQHVSDLRWDFCNEPTINGGTTPVKTK